MVDPGPVRHDLARIQSTTNARTIYRPYGKENRPPMRVLGVIRRAGDGLERLVVTNHNVHANVER